MAKRRVDEVLGVAVHELTKHRVQGENDAVYTVVKYVEDSNANISVVEQFVTESDGMDLFEHIRGTVNLGQFEIFIYGRLIPQPRLIGFVGASVLKYTYSGRTFTSTIWSDQIACLCYRVNVYCNTHFNSCLINYYRDGNDSIGWHSDNEKELGDNQCVAALTLGSSERVMKFRPLNTKYRATHGANFSVNLRHGELLVMQGNTQRSFMHSIAKTATEVGPRMSLTFRTIKN